MIRIHGKKPFPRPIQRPVVTLGTFDGVHLGHQALIRQVNDWAREIGGESVILTFDRSPKAVLSGMPPSFITSLEHRLVLFERLGVSVCVVLEFTQQLAQLTAEDFVREYFQDWLGAAGVLLGYDCRFGNSARGNVDLLKQLAPRFGFEVRAFEQVRTGNLVPSSTAIRQAIASAQLDQAAAMLGRPVSIFGDVVRGDERGRKIGFPTANLDPHHEVVPPSGVYACRVEVGSKDYQAVTNIGVRPTVTDAAQQTIETHLLDFSDDLYGRVLEVRFVARLRSERKFAGIEELKAQIAADIRQARAILSAESAVPLTK